MNAATKTAKFTIFGKTIDKVYEIYSKGCWETPSKVTRIVKITKFTKTAKFTIICKTIDKVYEVYSKGCREALSKVTRIAKITKFTNCKVYAMDERTNQVYSWYLYTVIMLIMTTVHSGKPDYPGLEGSPVQSLYENCENYEIYEKCEIYKKS